MFNFNKINLLSFARYSLIALLISLLVTPPFTTLAELCLLLSILLSSEIRARIITTFKMPTVKALMLFYLVITIGVFYSMGSTSETFKMWLGWKKLLLFPIGLALFDDAAWKNKAIFSFIIAATIFAFISFTLATLGIYTNSAGHELGVIVRNHSTQGMFFSIAAFAALTHFLTTKNPVIKIILAISTAMLTANVMLIATGRSGYIVMLVCILVLIVSSIFSASQVSKSQRALLFALMFAVSTGLILSKKSHDRIQLAISEVQNAHIATTETSMGIRIIFWENTIQLIKNSPLLGYGTGSFRAAYTKQVENKTGIEGTIAGDPHNQLMKIITEHGILGALPFLSFLVLLFFTKGITYPYRLLGIGAACAWIATSMANSHFSTFSEGMFIFSWLGMMLNLSSINTNRRVE